MSDCRSGNGSSTSADFTSGRGTSSAFSSINDLDSIPGPSGMSKTGLSKWPKDSIASNVGKREQFTDGNGVSCVAPNTRSDGGTMTGWNSYATAFTSELSKYGVPEGYQAKVANILRMLQGDDQDEREVANLGGKSADSDTFSKLAFDLDSSLNDVD
ncbi:hypothetical protein MTO96_018056 [Rhipicephalus appendiculatus]